jgi:hypothetical protein
MGSPSGRAREKSPFIPSDLSAEPSRPGGTATLLGAVVVYYGNTVVMHKRAAHALPQQ